MAAALDDLEETVQKRKEGQSETFVDDVIMYEVLSELRDIAAQGRHLLHLRAQGLRHGGPRRGGGPGVPRLRRAAPGQRRHRRGPGPAVLPVQR